MRSDHRIGKGPILGLVGFWGEGRPEANEESWSSLLVLVLFDIWCSHTKSSVTIDWILKLIQVVGYLYNTPISYSHPITTEWLGKFLGAYGSNDYTKLWNVLYEVVMIHRIL